MGFRSQSSFAVHIPVAIAVIVAAFLTEASTVGWCILILCIAFVLAMETMNSALEVLVKKLHPQPHQDIRNALDMASGAVLIASIGAAIIGLLHFLN